LFLITVSRLSTLYHFNTFFFRLLSEGIECHRSEKRSGEPAAVRIRNFVANRFFLSFLFVRASMRTPMHRTALHSHSHELGCVSRPCTRMQ